MKKLLFSLILIGVIVPNITLSTTTSNTSGAGGTRPGSLEEELFKTRGSTDATKRPPSIKDGATGKIKYLGPDGGYYLPGDILEDSTGKIVVIGENGVIVESNINGGDPKAKLIRIDKNGNITTSDLQENKNPTPIPSESKNSILGQIVPTSFFGGQPLNKLLNQLFYIGLVIAVILALVMIIRGGVEYMTIDAISSKESGKNRVKAALGGLLLAFSAIMILNTINPSLTKLSIVFKPIEKVGQINIDGLTSGTRPATGPVPTGNYGNWSEGIAEGWVNGLENGVRSTDGRLVVSTYSATGDSVTDSNTSARRGNANNLLREGSVALSPDLIAQYRPKTGQEVFINGMSVGFYEDATASQYNGVQFRNTIDIYDENKTIGSKLKNVPAGAWNISFGDARSQISNP